MKFEIIDPNDGQYYRKQYAQLCTAKYDDQLLQTQELSWLPWVGVGYDETHVLIVGDSHYCEREKDKRSLVEDPYYTRAVLADVRAQPTYDTVLKLFCRSFMTDEVDTGNRMRFWSSVAFMNLSQRPVQYDSQNDCGRPSTEDYVEGWGVLARVIKILRPSFCLLLGTEGVEDASGTEEHKPYYIARNRRSLVSGTDIIEASKIGRCFPRPFLVKSDDAMVPMLAVLHPSRMHDIGAWRSFAEDFRFQAQDYNRDHKSIEVSVSGLCEFAETEQRIGSWYHTCDIVVMSK